MKKWNGLGLLVAAIILALSEQGSTQTRYKEPGLSLLEQAWSDGQKQIQRLQLIQTPPAPSAPLIAGKYWPTFPVPDENTLARLKSRIPELDVSKVRVASLEAVDRVMQRAAERKITYLDVLTDEGLGRNEIYYVPENVLQAVGRKYADGILPYSGRTQDLKDFRMEAFVAGQGRLDFLYNLDEDFRFEIKGYAFKIAKGRVSGRIDGPGVLGSIQGLQVHVKWKLWATFQKWVKEAQPYMVRVHTNLGSQPGKLYSIRST